MSSENMDPTPTCTSARSMIFKFLQFFWLIRENQIAATRIPSTSLFVVDLSEGNWVTAHFFCLFLFPLHIGDYIDIEKKVDGDNWKKISGHYYRRGRPAE